MAQRSAAVVERRRRPEGEGRVAASAARERILETATELFSRHGVNSVGIDLVIARSGVAKMTLYRHFRSKEDLVLAFLEKAYAERAAWLRERVAAARVSERNRPLVIFDVLEEWFDAPDYCGCPFIGTAAEVRDPKEPVHRAAWRLKRMLIRDYLLELLQAGGYRNAPVLADQLLMLVDGAAVRAAMEGGSAPARAAKRVAALLLRR